MRITIKLGGRLRDIVPGHAAGELDLEVPDGAYVSQVLDQLGLGGDQVRVLLLNGRQLLEDGPMVPGDRLALFPKELAFNMYVATAFFNPLCRKEIGQRRQQGVAKDLDQS